MGNSGKGELIETLWNVNLHDTPQALFRLYELIETLWNVNNKKAKEISDRLRINRNIVECKLTNIKPASFLLLRINRNIVECK